MASNAENTTQAHQQLASALRVIRYLRSKCAGIAHLGHGPEAAVEGLMVTNQWDFLDYMEPEEAARTLIAGGSANVQ